MDAAFQSLQPKNARKKQGQRLNSPNNVKYRGHANRYLRGGEEARVRKIS